jgi:hypothetical protein
MNTLLRPRFSVTCIFLFLLWPIQSQTVTESARHSHFASRNSSRNIPIVEDNGHVFVRGRIHGVGPEWITLDTGAGYALVNKARVNDLGIKPSATFPIEGASGTEMAQTVSDIEFELPGVSLQHQSAVVLPLDFISQRTGHPVAALLGYEFFKTFVVEIDFARQLMNLYHPASFQYHGSGEIVPLQFEENLPYMTASLKMPDGEIVTGRFVIDLGSEIPVMVRQDFATRHDLLRSLHPTMETIGRGVGGADFKIVNARIPGVEIQHTLVVGPIVAFPQSQGAIAAEDAVGNIGAGLLRHFRVIFDYAHQRMILEPGTKFTEPFEADMSGLLVVVSGPRLETFAVARVRQGSLADDAGFQVGDQLLALDGKPIPRLGVLKQALRQDGRELELMLKRGETTQVRKLKLRRVL